VPDPSDDGETSRSLRGAGDSRVSRDSGVSRDSRLSLLRELSEQAVLETIFREGPITRPEVSAATGLSKPTVSSAVQQLEQLGMIRALGPQHGRRGRSPIAYVVRDNAGFVVGVDIGGTNIRAGAADIFGERICDEQHPTTREGGRAVSAQVMEIASRVVQRASGTHERVLAIGISTPGVVDQASNHVRLAYNVSADGDLDPLGAIGSRFDVPVLIENNVNLAAVGEKWFGLARGVSTMVYIAIGAGVGLGIIIDDELVRGAHGAAGEIAYLPLVGDPFDPRHRLHGGLEDEVGAAGVLSAFNERRDRGAAPASSAQEVFELAGSGDQAARAVVEHVASRVGAAIATVSAILDPDLVVLGGGIGSSPLLLRPVRGAASALVPITARIETSLLGDRAALQGAIAVGLHAARSQLLPQVGATPETRKNVATMRQRSQ
jgi:predicted NBD/HSP70 family sugar kinase